MRALLFEKAAFKVLTVFSLEPGSRWQRKELQTHTLLSNKTLDDALKRLRKAGVISKDGRLYTLRDKNLATYAREEYVRLGELPFNVHFALLDLARLFVEQEVTLILFGSYAKLTYTTKSDLDVAVLHGKKYRRPRVERVEQRYGIPIELHEFEKTPFLKNKRDPLIKEILKNGKEL